MLALIGASASVRPAQAATVTASVTASASKPLTLTKVQDFDLGTLTLAPGTWSNVTVSISQGGALSCSNTNVVCSGATKPAEYNVQGSNQQTVFINAPSVTLTNQADPTKSLTLTMNAPASIVLTNSGFPGVNFFVGGSVTVSSTTASGTYSGTLNVTVNY
jgi:hypothetical protein